MPVRNLGFITLATAHSWRDKGRYVCRSLFVGGGGAGYLTFKGRRLQPKRPGVLRGVLGFLGRMVFQMLRLGVALLEFSPVLVMARPSRSRPRSHLASRLNYPPVARRSLRTRDAFSDKTSVSALLSEPGVGLTDQEVAFTVPDRNISS
jgi:hypothetical protein